ncbi:MAG: SRPBCC family protein [Saprospiraceae bacterium]|nr:SRPBCC family protein [Saprospiraceae bacterium]
MRVKRKEWVHFIPQPLETVWSFFSRPENLNEMTPEQVSFDILTDVSGIEMYEGLLICYRISPFGGIKMNWVTEITHIHDQQYFVDEQRFGPYAMWHHEHHFKEVEGGVRMKDVLHYKVPYGPIGRLADFLFVDRMIEDIFSFRQVSMIQKFGEWDPK